MRVLGMIAGGSLGLAIGGPIGAILGGVLGSKLGDLAPQLIQPFTASESEEAQATFVLGLTCMAAKVAKSDGVVSKEEVTTFDRFLRDELGLSHRERKTAALIFNKARDSSTPASEYALQLGRLFRDEPDRLQDLVTILFSIARADGVSLDEEEEDLIRRIARDMGLSVEAYRSCQATFRSSRGDSSASPYDVLGVAPTASDQEVRSAHRRLVRDYHPDVLASKGLPDELLEFARQKMIAANDAWAQIRAKRG